MGSILDNGLAWLSGAKAAIITALACIAICLPLGYCKGESAANAKHRAEIARVQAESEKKQRAADELIIKLRAQAAASIQTARQEADNAVANLPDKPVSDRQHARACLELVRQRIPEAQLIAAGCTVRAP